MSLRKAISLGVFLVLLQAGSVALWGQNPDPIDLQDLNLFPGQSKEPSTLLVLPKGLTQSTLLTDKGETKTLKATGSANFRIPEMKKV